MNNKKRSKLKSAKRFDYFKSFGWLSKLVYRNRRGRMFYRYLKSGKYFEERVGEEYELVPGTGLWVQNLVLSSTVRRSRIKNIPHGCASPWR